MRVDGAVGGGQVRTDKGEKKKIVFFFFLTTHLASLVFFGFVFLKVTKQ